MKNTVDDKPLPPECPKLINVKKKPQVEENSLGICVKSLKEV